MKYEIKGENLPVVICYLEENEKMITEQGAMAWMSPNMEMATSTNGIGKAIARTFSGESLFQNIYCTKRGNGLIAFASSFPGVILPFKIDAENEIIVQKKAFLAATEKVQLSTVFNKKVSAGLFGGEGFIMQKLSGKGLAFVEIDGSVMEYQLAAGESIVLDTGYLAAYRKGNMQAYTFSGKRVHRGLYKTNGGLIINADINGAGNILRKEYPYAYDGQNMKYLCETTEVVSYTDIYAGAKSVCKEKYNQKSHEPGLGSRVNHRYRQDTRLIYRKLWGRSTVVWTGKKKTA